MSTPSIAPPGARTLAILAIPALAIGVVSALILWLLNQISGLLADQIWTTWPDALGLEPYSPWWTFGVLTLTGAAVGLVVWLLPGHAGPDSATTELSAPPLPLRVLPGLALAVTISLAGGVSLGPENPIIAINTAVAVTAMARFANGGADSARGAPRVGGDDRGPVRHPGRGSPRLHRDRRGAEVRRLALGSTFPPGRCSRRRSSHDARAGHATDGVHGCPVRHSRSDRPRDRHPGRCRLRRARHPRRLCLPAHPPGIPRPAESRALHHPRRRRPRRSGDHRRTTDHVQGAGAGGSDHRQPRGLLRGDSGPVHRDQGRRAVDRGQPPASGAAGSSRRCSSEWRSGSSSTP